MRVNADEVRQALQNADLTHNMTRRIGQAFNASNPTVFANLAEQGTNVRTLVYEERQRRLRVWMMNPTTTRDLASTLGYLDRASARAFLKANTGKSWNEWTKIWRGEQQ